MRRYAGRWLVSGLLLAGNLPIAPGACPAAATLWVEAELFRDPGGWTSEAQFVDQMGSPYLLAIGLERPVRDAVTQVQVPAAGTYRLWVRDRNWLPRYSPGRFQVIVEGCALARTFGMQQVEGWTWEDGGTLRLPAGGVEIRLHDLTGHYGRCDALVLTDDLAYRPPHDPPALAEAREKFGGVSRHEPVLQPYDTVVVGGGLAGCFAAVASARGGCRTALVQDRPVLGGNTSSEVLVEPQGDTTALPLDPGEGGIIEEVRGKAEDYSPRLMALVRRQPRLDLFLNMHATGVHLRAPGEIAAVRALEVTTGRRFSIPGTIFIDCTGDGTVGVAAGAEYRHGREPRSMYGESRAPATGDLRRGTMGGTLRYRTEIEPRAVAFHAPDWARRFPACTDFGPGRHPQLRFGGWQWVIEHGGARDTCQDAEEIRDELVRIVWGMWDHAKNHCPKLAGQSQRFRLTWVSHVVGKRESRRLIGDYVMTEHDITPARLLPDRVAYGGWGVDLHPPQGFDDPGPPAVFSHHVQFSVPFRSLYSKNVDNLLMAGRCISVSHAALGATRVMITCGLQGQAAGTAAALCRLHAAGPRGICQHHIGQLQQQLLKDGCYLIGLPNRDPLDLARAAAVSASSSADNGQRAAGGKQRSEGGGQQAAGGTGLRDGRRPTADGPPPFAPENVLNGIARAAGGRPNSWRPAPGGPLPQWVELDFGRPVAMNCVHVSFQTRRMRADDFHWEVPAGDRWQTVAAVRGNDQRRRVDRFAHVRTAKLRLVIDKARQDMGVCQIRVYDEPD
jgi:hypothetical protein